jgi:hypothetical protein
MKNKKAIFRELTWLICGIIAGICVSLVLYDIINVDLDLGVISAGVVATLLAIYVVRMTIWVFKKAM